MDSHQDEKYLYQDPAQAPQVVDVKKDPVYESDVVESIVMKDGLPLHPQPTSDPLDPLNWSRWRKVSILAIVMWM